MSKKYLWIIALSLILLTSAFISKPNLFPPRTIEQPILSEENTTSAEEQALSLEAVEKVFIEECDTNPASSILLRDFKTLKDFFEKAQPVKTTSDGNKVFILPCGMGAYQSWQIPVLYDAGMYFPLSVPSIQEDGSRVHSNTAIFFEYDKETDSFSSTAKGNGAGTCWESAEYKLTNKQLILQKFTADWDCGSEADDSKVIFDITKQ